MDHILKERDRLLQRTSRVYGLCFSAIALVCLFVPGAVETTTYLPVVPLFAVLAVSQVRVGSSRSPLWIALEVVSALAIVATIAATNDGVLSPAALAAIAQLTAASLASVALVLSTDRLRLAVLVAVFLLTVAVTTWCTAASHPPFATVDRKSVV